MSSLLYTHVPGGAEGAMSPQAGAGLSPVLVAGFRDDGQWLAARSVPAADTVGGNLMILQPGGGVPNVLGEVAVAFHTNVPRYTTTTSLTVKPGSLSMSWKLAASSIAAEPSGDSRAR